MICLESFERYQKWNRCVEKIPALEENMNGIITRSLILTRGNLEEVEFITGVSKARIFKVVEWLAEQELMDSIEDGTINIEDEKEENATMSILTDKKSRKERTFTREEMVNFTKNKLLQANPAIEFVKLSYNILTCKLNEESFTVYISSSRDFEFMKEPIEIKPERVSAWHKGAAKIFDSYDYYAFLVKIDEQTKYISESDENIEGIFVSKDELDTWRKSKSVLPSGMINFYIHYIQDQGDSSVRVIDERENPEISLNHLYEREWKLR